MARIVETISWYDYNIRPVKSTNWIFQLEKELEIKVIYRYLIKLCKSYS